TRPPIRPPSDARSPLAGGNPRVRRRFTRTAGAAGREAPLPEAEEGTEGTGGLAAFFLGDPQGGGNIQVAGERRAHRGHRGTAVAGDVTLRPSRRRVQALEPGGRRVQARRAEVPVLGPAAIKDQQPDSGRGILLEQVADQDEVAR